MVTKQKIHHKVALFVSQIITENDSDSDNRNRKGAFTITLSMCVEIAGLLTILNLISIVVAAIAGEECLTARTTVMAIVYAALMFWAFRDEPMQNRSTGFYLQRAVSNSCLAVFIILLLYAPEWFFGSILYEEAIDFVRYEMFYFSACGVVAIVRIIALIVLIISKPAQSTNPSE